MEATLSLHYSSCRFTYAKPFASTRQCCRSTLGITLNRGSTLVFPTDLDLSLKQSNTAFKLLPRFVNCFLTQYRYNKDDQGEEYQEEKKGITDHYCWLGATVAMASVLGVMGLCGRSCPPALAFQLFPQQERSLSVRSLSLASLRSGKEALQGMLDAKKARLNPTVLETAETDLQQLLKQDNFDPHELQKVVWKLEMSGKEDKVVRTLQDRFESEIRKPNPDRAYEVGLLWVEMLIYQGKYWYARKVCNELQLRYMEEKKEATDARPSLYLAVTNLMLGDVKAAREQWKTFSEIQSRVKGGQMTGLTANEIDPAEATERTVTFEEFKEHMEVLKREIDEARK
ncbi:hypothetical protein H6P81_014159 [Aristolochia fimbriata]|uniref:Uncharacterized protein n=1 Tax=Aristolochia fimbriata TaxID=158543 RepID=A0AAV7EJI6_ARIFI|nr:hypothetical protein H6P81_014159 [Aristolochia fimbriata]